MKYRHLGNSGLEVSVIGLGTNNFGGRMESSRKLRKSYFQHWIKA